MLDVNKQIVTKLKTILPTYYELFPKKFTLPCITYMTYDNQETNTGNTLAYSSIGYYIKVWGKGIDVLMPYMQQVDTAMREIGYTRQSYNELVVDDGLCLIAQYRGLGKEELTSTN